MSYLMMVAFTIHTYIDPDGEDKHFDAQEITKNLHVIPFHAQSYDPYYNDVLHTGIIDNPHFSSWIYRSGGYYESTYNEEKEMFILEDLFMQMRTALFTPEKLTYLKALLKEYGAHCYLDIYTFNGGDYINKVSIPAEFLATIADLNVDIAVRTHSKDISYYRAYFGQKLFTF